MHQKDLQNSVPVAIHQEAGAAFGHVLKNYY
jgi:hypothetical protein